MNAFRSNRTLIATWNYWYYVLPKSLLIAYVVLPPVAGLMIYICRRWSYWGYIFCISCIFAANVYGFWTDVNLLNLAVLLVILLLDLIAVAYFVVPSVRSVYFDPKARWWETAPRFTFDLEARMNEQSGFIRNVSVGGLFIEAADVFNQDQDITVEWSYEESRFQIPATIVYKNPKGYGVKFRHSTNTQKQIKKFIQLLQSQGVAVMERKFAGDDNFLVWVKNLVMKGEGLFPRR